MPYSQNNNPVKMMKSALEMHKAEKKAGMHRDSAMYMNHSPMEMGHSPMEKESRELKDMPIVDIEKGDAKGDMKKDSPAMNYDTDKGSHSHPHSPMNRQGYDDRLDESLAKDGKESSKKQSMKDRRDESKGMEKSKGKGAYSSDPKMS
tara:strand:+ start:1083 stop:1526 length:444 start_codon:yes stop_codon:yes gene_type:complete